MTDKKKEKKRPNDPINSVYVSKNINNFFWTLFFRNWKSIKDL